MRGDRTTGPSRGALAATFQLQRLDRQTDLPCSWSMPYVVLLSPAAYADVDWQVIPPARCITRAFSCLSAKQDSARVDLHLLQQLYNCSVDFVINFSSDQDWPCTGLQNALTGIPACPYTGLQEALEHALDHLTAEVMMP